MAKLLQVLEQMFGDDFGLAREDEWTYYFGDVPILDMEHKTGEVPRWLASFYHGSRPDPDEGGPWPNNVYWETIVGPVAVAILDAGDKVDFVAAHVLKGTEDEYKVSERISVPRDALPNGDRPPAIFIQDMTRLVEVVGEALDNAEKEEAGPGDYVYFEYEDGRILVGRVESIDPDGTITVYVIRTFGDEAVYGGERWEDLPDTVKISPDKLFPVPVSGFGYEG